MLQTGGGFVLGGFQCGELFGNALFDFGKAGGLGFVVGFFECVAETGFVCAAVAFDDDAAQPEQDSTVEFARIEFVFKPLRAGRAATAASLLNRLLWNSRRMAPLMNLTAPSMVLSMTLPTKPSATTTSASPYRMPLLSMLPIKLSLLFCSSL